MHPDFAMDCHICVPPACSTKTDPIVFFLHLSSFQSQSQAAQTCESSGELTLAGGAANFSSVRDFGESRSQVFHDAAQLFRYRCATFFIALRNQLSELTRRGIKNPIGTLEIPVATLKCEMQTSWQQEARNQFCTEGDKRGPSAKTCAAACTCSCTSGPQ